jgi:hypothetical protein
MYQINRLHVYTEREDVPRERTLPQTVAGRHSVLYISLQSSIHFKQLYACLIMGNIVYTILGTGYIVIDFLCATLYIYTYFFVLGMFYTGVLYKA